MAEKRLFGMSRYLAEIRWHGVKVQDGLFIVPNTVSDMAMKTVELVCENDDRWDWCWASDKE